MTGDKQHRTEQEMEITLKTRLARGGLAKKQKNALGWGSIEKRGILVIQEKAW